MTGKERFSRILRHEPVDRIGLYEHFWGDTQKEWVHEGSCREEDDFEDMFGFDISECWAANMTADLDFEPKIVSETADTVTLLDGNGAVLRRHKHHDTTPEHVDYTVKSRADWEREIKPRLTPSPRRLHFEKYRQRKVASAERGMERKTATVARRLPRKTMIMSPVRQRPMAPSCSRFSMAVLTKTD